MRAIDCVASPAFHAEQRRVLCKIPARPDSHLELKTTLCYTIREIKLYVQLYSCMYNYIERIDQSQWNILHER